MAIGEEAEVSSVRPPADMSAGEWPVGSDWLDVQGERTAELGGRPV